MPRPAVARLRKPVRPDEVDSALVEFAGTFANPGALRMRMVVPPALAPNAPLVVVLHGCTQTAAGYDRGSGWSTLAATLGFALLFPEQIHANNANGCFNWFEANDSRRGSGEAASIAAAVAAMVATHRLDPTRVFISGLSAGGAMANAMLATYPDVFAGGAIIAGLPFGVAHGVPEAMQVMNHPANAAPRVLGDRVRAASTFTGPWPIVSVWHGGDDRTVALGNGEAVAAQWADVHGATSDGASTIWRNAAGITVVEFNRINGMGHGTPIDAGVDGCVAAPFMLDVGIRSSAMIAAFWGLGEAPATVRTRPAGAAPRRDHETSQRPGPDVARLINDTLRSVGLMK